MLLPIPYYPQEHVTSCILAAVRMVLSFWPIDQNELALSQILHSGEEGTGILNIEFLQEAGIGVTVWVGKMDAQELKQNLDQGVPVIVAVWTADLPYWKVNRPHAVVVVGYDEKTVYLNDPKFPDAPQTIAWDNFLAAWD